jgi:hypothetical protein
MSRARSKINKEGNEKIFGRLKGAGEEMDLRETGYKEVTQRLGLRVTSHREKLFLYVVTISNMLKSVFSVFLIRRRRLASDLIHNTNYL